MIIKHKTMERKKFVVIGLGKFGFKLVEELNEMGLEVVAIDSDSEKIEKIRDIASESIILNATDKEALEKCGVRDVDAVVVCKGREMEISILITSILKEIGVKEIICRAENSLHAKILKKIGADVVIYPEEDMAVRLAHTIHFPDVREYIEIEGPWDLAGLKISKKSKLVGRKIGDILRGTKERIDILMIEKILRSEKEKKGTEIKRVIPKSDYKIENGDVLILFAKPKDLDKFIKKNS